MAKELSEMSLEELWQLFPIILKEHNEEYARWYEEEKENILSLLHKQEWYRINHIGSTAVKNLLAKPTVDILLEINPDCDVVYLKERLLTQGWLMMHAENEPEFRWVLNKGYTSAGFAEKVYHLHVRLKSDWDELYFRDYLMEHPQTAEDYAKLKRVLGQQFEHDRDGYTEAKTEFIQTVTKRAKLLYLERYMPKERELFL
ncbi:GrpB family protein [Scatolibacter rhodanostii]|uniref:GrpB family protein n=1 Tax=Scatolibacter rhodanostii TaxID=2014781 RepID=UPI000C07BE60|nr:GrpB family protein [Scatolibacter rhodanostii]